MNRISKVLSLMSCSPEVVLVGKDQRLIDDFIVTSCEKVLKPFGIFLLVL